MAKAHTRRAGWGVRRTSVLIAVVVVFGALLCGGALLVLILQSALAAGTEEQASERAADIAAVAREAGLPAAVQEVHQDSRTGQLLQVLSADHQVLASSVPKLAHRALSGLQPAAGATASERTDIAGIGEPDDFVVAAQGVQVDGQPYVVLVAAPLQVQAETVSTVAFLLLGATPLLLAVVGVAVWVLVGRALEPVAVMSGQVSRISGRNLSERVAVPATRDEIAALATTMNVMLDRLEASDRAQRSFVSDASHELRSPLSSVMMAAEVSAADPDPTRWRQRVQTILVESRRMHFLVDNLMTLAQADSHDLALRRDDVDLDDVVHAEVRLLAERSTRELRATLPPTRVSGDPPRLAQVVRNLLENADRHARSRIEVSLQVESGRVLLRVDNDGDVIAPQLREQVFERFVRLDDSRSRSSGGSGLGLAISAEIVRAHDGTLVATESPAGWCRFEVALPASYEPGPEPGAEPGSDSSEGSPADSPEVRSEVSSEVTSGDSSEPLSVSSAPAGHSRATRPGSTSG